MPKTTLFIEHQANRGNGKTTPDRNVTEIYSVTGRYIASNDTLPIEMTIKYLNKLKKDLIENRDSYDSVGEFIDDLEQYTLLLKEVLCQE